MNQLTINIKNGSFAPKMNCQITHRISYARVLRYVDGKERVRPEVYEDDLLHVLG
ncbi:MAG: hypothetical protein HUJ97_01800 [Bacteroidales bacterium]|nr:hypothetical protein [Bacteroidales bacterium]